MSVFICYSSIDRAIAAEFHGALAAHDVPLWMDHADIPPGENWQENIDRAIRSCTHLVVLLSKNSIASDEVQAEWALAKDLGKTIVPILIDAIDVPYRLRQHQHVPYSNGQVTQQIDRVLPVLPRFHLPRITREMLPANAAASDYAQFDLRLRDHLEGITISANVRRFATISTLLNELFTHSLADLVAPYSYGSEWLIIGEPFSKAILAPIEWVENPGKPVHEIAPDWQTSTRPADAWIVPQSRWEVIVAEPKGLGGLNSLNYIKARAYGIVTNNDRVAAALRTNAKAIAFLRDRFRVDTAANVRGGTYKHSLVFSEWLNIGLIGMIGVDSDAELSDEIKRFLRW